MLHVHVHRAGHADGAEEQCDKAHQAQERIDVGQRPPELAFALLHRLDAEPLAAEPGAQVGLDRGGIAGCRQLKTLAVAHEAPRPDETGRRQRALRDEDARRKHRDGHRFARDFLERADHGECRLAQLDRIADAHAELHQQALLKDGEIAGLQARGGDARLGQKLAIKWEAALHRPHLHEASLVALRGEQDHRNELHLAGALAAEVGEKFVNFGRKRSAGSDDEVGAEERFRLVLDALAQVGGE